MEGVLQMSLNVGQELFSVDSNILLSSSISTKLTQFLRLLVVVDLFLSQ